MYDKIYYYIWNVGIMISPFDAFIALRGTKTLKLRVLKSAENALFVAKELEKHPKI